MKLAITLYIISVILTYRWLVISFELIFNLQEPDTDFLLLFPDVSIYFDDTLMFFNIIFFFLLIKKYHFTLTIRFILIIFIIIYIISFLYANIWFLALSNANFDNM